MTADDVNRDRLIERARQGEAGTLGRLLELYRNYLRLLARTGIDASLRGKADPSDIVQEALLKAARRFGQFHGSTEAELAGWLRQILARCLTDHVRRYRGRGRAAGREQSLEQLLGRSSLVLERILATDSASPSASAEQRDLAVVLADVVAELSPDHRDVLVLHDLEGLGWDEVAQRMGRTAGAVRMLWTRALKQLRPLIEARLGPLPEGHE
jgi:RNA polymerase sigma-70 factor, ECF subfamily